MNLELYEKCQTIKDFPKGEFYVRRKPKWTSAYANLEQRLADDICELMSCLDTEIVIPEIRCMFKSLALAVVEDYSNGYVINMYMYMYMYM